MTQEPWNDLNFRSGMLQSWNKFWLEDTCLYKRRCGARLTLFSSCARSFTGGYIEVNLSLPGKPTAQGYWPG